MKHTHAVGIDLGTTYSNIAWLNEYGQPVTIPNQEGELSTPSVVFFDGEQPIVGTEAMRNAIASPERVVQHAKRFMGHAEKFWKIGDTRYSPVHISGMILRKLIAAAQEQIGEIREAVITVPAQFSDAQRHATMLAGHSAGLERIEMINEPVAAALCHVLGNEGLAFTELAIDQQLLVFDLGGGTLDLAIVNYKTNEVRVVASDGDLELGGLDFTQVIVDAAAEKFIADFGDDPRSNRGSLQFLTLEAEQAKRSLSVRPRAAVTVQHEGHRRTYQIEQAEFESLSRKLIQRSEEITRRILKDNKFGWAHIDVVLTTGGASRMPMIRESLKKLSGRTLNSSLSPDQSIAHGAAYYAGMLLSNNQYARTVFNSTASSRLAKVHQQSVNSRALGILVRNEEGQRVPHYLIQANTPLPVSTTHVFGTVVDHQTRVHVQIVESGAGTDRPPTILGNCRITGLPADLPEGTEIEVTISYDHQARVHVAAQEPVSGLRAEAEIIRQENLNSQLQEKPETAVPLVLAAQVNASDGNAGSNDAQRFDAPSVNAELSQTTPAAPLSRVAQEAVVRAMNKKNGPAPASMPKSVPAAAAKSVRQSSPKPASEPRPKSASKPGAANSPDVKALQELANLFADPAVEITGKADTPVKPRQSKSANAGPPNKRPKSGNSDSPPRRKPTSDPNEAEFWDLVDDE